MRARPPAQRPTGTRSRRRRGGHPPHVSSRDPSSRDTLSASASAMRRRASSNRPCIASSRARERRIGTRSLIAPSTRGSISSSRVAAASDNSALASSHEPTSVSASPSAGSSFSRSELSAGRSAGGAEDREELTRTVAHRLAECIAQPAELRLAADHRRVEPPRVRLVAAHREQAMRGDRLGLALQDERRHLLDLDRVARQPERRIADQDFARGACLFQSRGEVDGVARRESLRRAGDDLAGRDADPALAAEGREDVAHLHRGS